MLLKSVSIYTVFLFLFLSTARGIWNGRTASLNRFPYAALIVANYNNTHLNPFGEWDCSGALISDMFVITASFCVQGILKFRIKIGGHYNGNVTETDDFDNFTVYDHVMFSKPYYAQDFANSTNELAMIPLNPKVIIRLHIRPVNIPLSPQSYDTNSSFTAFATGWGANLNKSEELQYLHMHIISDSVCMREYPAIDIRTMLCAQGYVRNGKQGVVCRDVGAPLALFDRTLIGISIYSRPCNQEGPELFTRVEFFANWIRYIDSMKFNKTLYPYYE